VCVNITGSAVALSRVLRTAFVPYGNMETSTPHSAMKLCMLITSVRRTHVPSLVGIRPLGSLHTYVKYTLLVTFLPAFLTAFVSCAPAQAKRIEIIARTSAKKDAVWRKEVPSQQVFFSHLTFWGSFCPKSPKFRPQPNKKVE